MTVHILTAQSSIEYSTGCGQTIKSRDGMPDDITAWHLQVSCVLCATRPILHQKLESYQQMAKLIDLDDPAVAKKFHFAGKRWGFRWLIGKPLIYIFDNQNTDLATCAIPLGKDLTGVEVTYEVAQQAARTWIIEHGDKIGAPIRTEKARRRPPAKRVPTGPHCAACLKRDEGDLIDHPDKPDANICMTCYIGGKR